MNESLTSFYIGTYGKSHSSHLYHVLFDETSGQFDAVTQLVEAKQSSYLARTSWGMIISVMKTDEQGGIAVFSPTGELIEQALDAAPPPCHVCFDDARRLVYVCNYHTGTVSVYQISETGRLQLADCVALGDTSHPHSATIATDGLVIVCALGLDCLISYDVVSGQLVEISRHNLPKGTGPRHLAFYQQQKIVYVVGEKNNSLTSLIYDGYGAFDDFETHSTIPETTGETAAAAIVISSCQNYLYVSNRGHDSIACFSIGNDGGLSEVAIHPLSGKIPRDMCLSPNGQYLIVACQASHDVLSLAIDNHTGQLQLTGHLNIPEAVAIIPAQ